MSLVEVMLIAGIMGVIALAMTSLFTQQVRSSNFLEFQTKREQLRLAVIGQFLSNPLNCKCLFAGASDFPQAGASELTGVSPAQLGPYQFVTPGDCTTATVPVSFVNTAGLDGLIAERIELRDIVNISGNYLANLLIVVSPTKTVAGPISLPIKIPVAVETVPSGANRRFESCSMTAAGAPMAVDYGPTLDGVTWYSVGQNASGGPGIPGSRCGPFMTVTITDPAILPTTPAAVIAFYSLDGTENSPAARITTLAGDMTGFVGQAGRGGDGKSYGAGGEVTVPLTNRQFRMQMCKRSGDFTNFFYGIKAVIN